MSDNKDTLINLLSKIPHVDSAAITEIPPEKQKPENQGYSGFHCYFKSITGEDKIAGLYLSPTTYEDPLANDSVVASVTDIVNHLYNGGTIANYQPPTPSPPPAT